MKVLLINSKIPNARPWVPLGISYIASYLRKHGIDVKIADANLQNLNKVRVASLIKEYRPDIVGISAMTIQCQDALQLGKMIRNIDNDVKIVFGGVHFTFLPEDGLDVADICVIGEGEETLLDICRESDLYNIKGIAFRDKGQTIFNEARHFIDPLDNIPFPAYDLLDIDKYHDTLITGERAMSMLTGRGCPYNCMFCASPQLWKRRVRVHSIKYVISHIEFLVENYKLKNLRIMDDTFTLDRQRVLDFCDAIEGKGLALNITCLTNAKNVDYEMAKRMKEVGFSIVAIGVESGNEAVLKRINKGITLDDVRNAVTTLKKAGLDTELLFMVGNISENEKTVQDSINFAKEINPPESNSRRGVVYNYFQFATPFPGSKFYEVAEQHGIITTRDFSKYDHQMPVFIPKDLNAETMIKLRNIALDTCNRKKFWWVPSQVRHNSFVKKAYSLLSHGLLSNPLKR